MEYTLEYNLQDMFCKAKSIVLGSSFIASNTHYSEQAKLINFVFSNEEILNSCACMEESGKICIYTFRGMCVCMTLFASVFTLFKKNRNVKLAKNACKWIVDNLTCDKVCGDAEENCFQTESAEKFYTKFPMYCNRSYYMQYHELTIKLMACLLAHEVGHVCLSHISGGHGENNISRNQEREADSFACSILQGNGIGSDFAVAMVLLYVMFIYIASGCEDKFSTHPMSYDRAHSAIKSFEDEIISAGYNLNDIERLARI